MVEVVSCGIKYLYLVLVLQSDTKIFPELLVVVDLNDTGISSHMIPNRTELQRIVLSSERSLFHIHNFGQLNY